MLGKESSVFSRVGQEYTYTHTQTHTHTNTHTYTDHRLPPSSAEKAMQAEKRWHLLLSVILLLITSSRCKDSREAMLGDKQTLLDLLLRVIVDGEREKISTRDKSAHERPIEIVLRDVTIKDRFIKHFTGPVKFPSECRMHFHRIYHNTRECSRPAFYKRCARLLMRLAMSPLCAQP